MLGLLIDSIQKLAGVPRHRLNIPVGEKGTILAADPSVAGKKIYGQI